MSKKGAYSKRKKASDMKFYCIMLAFPLLQFVLMWIGVNINSILLAFKEIHMIGHYTNLHRCFMI